MKTWILVVGLVVLASSAQAQFRPRMTDSSRGKISQPSESQELMPAFGAYSPAVDSPNVVAKAANVLFRDNPSYYGRSPIWVPLVKITASNIALWLVDRYLLNFDFSKVSPATWAYNFKRGWTWEDSDRFGNDFFFHPFTGGGYFVDARSSGYSFWECVPFALFGSAEWKYFFENDQPSWGDLINTTVNGAFVGEAAYRLTSNVLDDSKTGPERILREAAVAVVSPSRFFARLFTGKLWEVSDTATLEKAATDVRLSVGVVQVNEQTNFNTGPVKADINLAIEYGDPFTTLDNRPFSHFVIGGELSNAYQRKLLGGVNGYGLITGTPVQMGPYKTVVGVFQHFNYNDNTAFELGDVAVGGGILGKLPVTEHHNFYTNLFLSLVPFAGNNAGFAPIDTTQQRDYNYNYGVQAVTEAGFQLGNRSVDLGIIAYYYYLHSFYGVPGENSIAIIKPRISVNIWKNLGIGFEHRIFLSTRTSPTLPTFSISRTEQRLYFQWTWDDFSKE
jgi:hypothetical protein